jgi:hypothetical protein
MDNGCNIRTWGLAADLVVETHRITDGFFERELKDMATQMQGMTVELLCNLSDILAHACRQEPEELRRASVDSLAGIEARVIAFEKLGIINDTQRIRELIEELRLKLNA